MLGDEGGMYVFDTGFAMLFRAVERIRVQLIGADEGLRRYLAEELLCLRRLGEQYIDHWMTLEDQIGDLMETHQLPIGASAEVLGVTMEINPGLASGAVDLVPDQPSPGSRSRTAPVEDFPLSPNLQGEEDVADLAAYGWKQTDHVAVTFRKGLAYYDLFMFSDAARSLEDVVNEMDTPVARLYLAASYGAQDLWTDATDQLAIVRNSTDDPLFVCAANEIEAQLLISQRNFEAAVTVLRQITDTIPKYADAWFNLSICYTDLGRDDLAEDACMKALKVDSTDVEVAVLLANIRLRMGKLGEAMGTCAMALDAHPQHVEILRLTAYITKAQGNYQTSIEICRELTQRVPEQGESWALLSWLYVKTGQRQQAMTILKKQLTLHPQHGAALLQLGLLYLLDGDMHVAERILIRCLTHSANKALIWVGLGVISLSQGNDRQAHTRFLRATKDTRQEVKRLALYLYGKALMKANRYAEAEKYLKAAAVLGHSNPAIGLALAVNAKRQGRMLEAEKLYNKAQQAFTQTNRG